MTLKFFSGLAILVLVLFLQIFLISSGISLNLVLAVLIAFAFVFDFWELLVFVLFSVFVFNWEPALSIMLFVFALIPLAAFVFRKFARSKRWIGSIAAIFVGFLIFYIAAAPGQFFAHIALFFMDIAVGLVAGE